MRRQADDVAVEGEEGVGVATVDVEDELAHMHALPRLAELDGGAGILPAGWLVAG
jgi:hypothetical protein